MVHMSLFLVMVGLIVQIVSLLRISDFISRRWKRYEKQVGTDTQLIADLANLELAREDSWWVWLNPFVYADVVDLHRLKLYVSSISLILKYRVPETLGLIVDSLMVDTLRSVMALSTRHKKRLLSGKRKRNGLRTPIRKLLLM